MATVLTAFIKNHRDLVCMTHGTKYFEWNHPSIVHHFTVLIWLNINLNGGVIPIKILGNKNYKLVQLKKKLKIQGAYGPSISSSCKGLMWALWPPWAGLSPGTNFDFFYPPSLPTLPTKDSQWDNYLVDQNNAWQMDGQMDRQMQAPFIID